jgi:Animal haem peroxidase
MSRLGHGETTRKSLSQRARTAIARTAKSAGLDVKTTDFGYMFPALQADPSNKLPPTAATVSALVALGKSMMEVDGEDSLPVGDSPIPAAFTYFGQFVDHDITLDTGSATIEQLSNPNLKPLANLDGLLNERSATLDLDSVYGGPRDPANTNRMLVGPVTPLNNPARPRSPIPGKSRFNDLPRQPPSDDPSEDRAAIIGDPRNDENTIVAQMHTAFLKAHNSLADGGMTFAEAKKALTLRYQSVVLRDFLPRICDPKVVENVIAKGAKYYGEEVDTFMPVEFAVAAYRFGHSMVRTNYDFNLNFTPFSPSPPVIPASLDLLFSFTALSGQLVPNDADDPEPTVGLPTLPENWVIQWERIAELGAQVPQKARAIDARLTPLLFKLRNVLGLNAAKDETSAAAKDVAPRLAVRNLLRGYLLGLPTGQAVARTLGLVPLEGSALIAALPTQALKTAAEPFKTASPLWFYVLAEAGNPLGPNGKHLGPVGSHIVAETLVSLIRRSPVSVLNNSKDPAVANFKLADLLNLAAQQDLAST